MELRHLAAGHEDKVTAVSEHSPNDCRQKAKITPFLVPVCHSMDIIVPYKGVAGSIAGLHVRANRQMCPQSAPTPNLKEPRMTISSEKAKGPGIFSFLRRKQPWVEISGYSVGDIHETQPVAIAAEATVVGNIFAPQIIIAGLLSGTAVSQEVIVQERGQIWGDIYALRFHVEQGGLIRGWVNTLSEAECYALLNGRQTLADRVPGSDNTLPDGLQPEHFRLRDSSNLDALHHLQTETAVALAARTELEETFDQRLAEIVGEATNQLTATREDLKTTRADLAKSQQQAKELSETLQLREAQLDRQTKELALSQETLAHTNQELEELRESFARKEAAFNELTSAKVGVDTHLHEALNQVDTLTGRVHNIETALQASLAHSSDQEDALLRWQELAESTEARVQELETELQNTRRQLEQSNDVNNMLRDQRKQVESEWTHAQIRLEELQNQLESETESSKILLAESDATILSLTNLNNQLKADLELLQTRNAILMKQMEMAKAKFLKQEQEISNLRAQYAELETEWQQTQSELERIRQQPTKLLSSDQLEELKVQLAAAEERAEEYQEQLLWHQANLETSQTALQYHQRQVEEQESQLRQLEQQVETLQRDLEEEKGKARADSQSLKELLRQKEMQLEASERDLQQHLRETAQQGQRLAEIQSTLIERELELQQVKQTVLRQQQFISKMKAVTTEKINSLENALAQARNP